MPHADLLELVGRLNIYIAAKEAFLYTQNYFSDYSDREVAKARVDEMLPFSGMQIPIEDLDACLRCVLALMKMEGLSAYMDFPACLGTRDTLVESTEAL